MQEKKLVLSSPAPTLVDPSHVSVLGKVEGDKVVKPKTTPAAVKKKRSDSPKPSASKKKPSTSSRPSSEDLKNLHDKWAETFSRPEAMLLAKSFTVPVEPIVKPAAEVSTSQKPFFDPGASTSSLARPASVTGPSLVQATGEAVDEMQTATQPLEAPGAGTATQPVQAPGSVPDVLPSGTGDVDLSAEQTLTGRVVQSSSSSDSEDDQDSVTVSLLEGNCRDVSPDRDLTRDESADQEVSEQANYRETIRGVRSFMGWHKVPEFESVSSSDDNPFASSRVQPTGKVSVKLPVDDWLCKKMDKLNLTITEGYLTLLASPKISSSRSSRWYGMHTEKKDCESNTVCTWSPEPANLNHSFSRLARRSFTAPPSRAFSQDILRHWERTAHEQTVMCNQAAGLSRCLTRVQDAMTTQLKTLHLDKKGKSSERSK